MSFNFRTAFCAAVLALNAGAAYSATIDVVFYDNRFGTYDDSTGVFTQLSTLPISYSAGIASMNGLLYLEDMGTRIFTVDPITGAWALVGNTGLTVTSGGFAGSSNGLFEVDYGSNLWEIDPLTGHADFVGSLGIAENNGHYDTSLAADMNYLYYTAGLAGQAAQLYRVDPATGHATDLGSTGITGIAGSAIVNGNLELFQYGQGTNYTYLAPVGSTNFTRGRQLSISIVDGGTVYQPLNVQSASLVATPEPSTIWLFVGGVALLTFSRFISLWNKRRSRSVEPPAPH